MRNNRAITLVEIMIAVIIVGILGSIALPHYFRQLEKANAGQALATLQNIQNIQRVYSIENETYTAVMADLTTFEPSLDTTDSNWTYSLSINGAGDEFEARATRSNGAYTGYYITLLSEEDPAPLKSGTIFYYDNSDNDIGNYPP